MRYQTVQPEGFYPKAKDRLAVDVCRLIEKEDKLHKELMELAIEDSKAYPESVDVDESLQGIYTYYRACCLAYFAQFGVLPDCCEALESIVLKGLNV